MTLVGFLVLASSASLMVQVVHTNEQCAFFSNQTTLVPGGDSHSVTMTFSVVNMCTNNAITSIQVSKMNTYTFYLHRICTLSFKDKSWIGGSGCVYKEPSQTFFVTSNRDNNANETWILVGELQNGDIFNTTVQTRFSQDKSTHVSFILVVSVSVGVIVAITFATLITVCCVKSKNNLSATQDTPRHPASSSRETYYLHPVNPGAFPDPPSPDTGARPQQCLLQSDADEDGYTFPDLPRSAGRKRNVTKPVYKNTGVATEGGDKATPSQGTSKHDDDGYILPEPVNPYECKRDDVQCLQEHTHTTTKRSDTGRAPRSHKYNDDGYVAPNPADHNQRGQVSNTSLYKNTVPLTGHAKTSFEEFDDDGYVMSDPPERCESKGDAAKVFFSE